MRREQALEIKQNWTAEQARNDLERLIITGERPADKVVGLACHALNKQIPIKVNISIKGTSDWNTRCHCPVCRKDLFDGQKYCNYCGQALDWSAHPTEKGGAEE